jgi:5-methylcytosine-specific restriction endonuclease McrA
MNWDNYGKIWEVDHIYPTSKGGSFHYMNTQPLLISENRKKSNKLI